MSSKVFRPSFLDMSQYANQITGNVIYDIRCCGAYLLDYIFDNTKSFFTNDASTGNTNYPEYSAEMKSNNSYKIFGSSSLYMKNYAISILRNIASTSDKVTISLWVYLINSGNRFQQIYFGSRNNSGSAVNGYGILPSYDQVSGNSCIKEEFNSSEDRVDSNIKLSLNSWHHLALVRNNNTVKYYIDGQAVITKTAKISAFDQTRLEISSTREDIMCLGEAVVITGQALWTGDSFEVPNNFLTGDKEFDSKYVIWNDKNTPTITGDVILNIRSVGDKIVDYSPIRDNRIYIENNIIETSITKYSDYSMNLINKKYLGVYKHIPMNQFTLSFWFNMLQYDNNGATFISMTKSDGTATFNYLIREVNNTSFLDWRLSSYNSYNFRTYKSSFNYSANTWYHIAITFDGTNYKLYENGILILTANYPYEFGSARAIEFLNSIKTVFDDVVLINNQVLWTDNFSPPNDLLLGRDYKPHRAYKKNIIWPINARQGDYFDKAYLY